MGTRRREKTDKDREPRVVISGYFGFNNAGDEAILTSMVGSLRRFVPRIQLTVISGNPALTAAQHQVKAVDRTDFPGIIRALRQADLLLSGGGSILQDVTSSRSLFYYLGIVVLAKLCGTRVMFFGQGVGPIRRPINRILTAFIANRVDLITVREAGSLETLQELGVAKPPIHVTADQVFCLEPAPADRAEAILAREGVDLDRPLVGISLRRWRDYQGYKEAVAQAADWLAEVCGAQIVFLPLQSPVDIPVAREVAALMKEPAVILEGDYSAQEFLAVTGRMDLIIGMRLHALIFAAVQGVPMVGIIYDPKVEDFLQLVEQPAAGGVADLTYASLKNCVQSAWQERKERGKILREKGWELVERAQENSRLVAQLLGEVKGGG
ncbi:MAG: polysaccharide pyruvyl transferase CsaB [bacterium]|jgi:polysaccharide pyruvyl transferase CsaB|nr:polysaccharide pyruvyl transferase CsaB [Bacillota bacterium]HHW55115.1 polysaccharide pyruvyl transferase CsaB [Bacillota bacterium]